MINFLCDPWIYWFAAIILSTILTIKAVYFLPWASPKKNFTSPFFLGFALSPFLLGFLSVLILKVFTGQSHTTHLVCLFVSLMICNLFIVVISKPNNKTSYTIRTKLYRDEKIALALLLCFICFLIYNSISYPLTQADALEYAQMGRIIYDTHTLASYPPIHPGNHPSGFYASVTHPPLYVALIYLSYLIQGNADTALLMKLLSPWCLIVATGLVFAIGNLINRRTGFFSAVIFISTPLLFLGASSSLIDSLSVLGFCLVFFSIFFFSTTPLKLGILQGVFLGVSLWVHSQALLFPILLIVGVIAYNGIINWKALSTQITTILVVSFLIGLIPYLNNYQNFGVLISDNPLVFNIKSLYWIDYFLIDRGIEDLGAQIQYGLFKGWFSPEAYGLTFWLMSLGLLGLHKPSKNKLFQYILGQVKLNKKILFTAFTVILAYHIGIILAIIIGFNQMFRIERYMLIIMPCVSIIAGYVFSNYLGAQNKTKLHKFFTATMILFICSELPVFIKLNEAKNTISNDTVIKYIRDNLHTDSLTLATLSADMYYTKQKMISNLDPVLRGFYLTKSPAKGFSILKDLGITHIYVTANSQPTFYNSTLPEIIANSKFSSLISNYGGKQLYKLNANQEITEIKKTKPEINLLASNIAWQKITSLIIGGRKAVSKITLSSELIKRLNQPTIESNFRIPFSLFQRDFTTTIQTKEKIKVQETSEYKFDISLEGHGLLRFWLTEYDSNDQLINKSMLNEIILGMVVKQKDYIHRFLILPNTKYIVIGIEHYGTSNVKITKAVLQ